MPARDRAVADGIIINGLPILNDRPTFGRVPPVPLDEYYGESVIGGPGAFLVVEEFESFGLAVRRKLIREISDLPPPHRTIARARHGAADAVPGDPARELGGEVE